MRMLDLIAKKRDGFAHSAEELAFISAAAAKGGVPDYQLSSWLMAVLQRGMTKAETVALTDAMARSGRTLKRVSRRPRVDKHSTGGVGDGISLALAPLVAAAGVDVPMMSGRGLGHTGGTLDKLESIKGFKVRLPVSQVERIVKTLGVCMFGQSADLAPADQKLYALRDATATVPARPLICGSILSKKIAENLDALVLDVKCGTGAIFQDEAKAKSLAKDLIATAEALGLKCVGLLTSMDQPLGRTVGNALEMRQAIAVLHGDASCPDYLELTLTLGGWMLHLAGKARSWDEGAERLQGRIADGSALTVFKKMVKAQGGDPRVADEPDRLPLAKRVSEVAASRDGFVIGLDALTVGRAGVALGAGRDKMEDALDFGAGIVLDKKVGDRVRKGETLAWIYASDAARSARGRELFEQAVRIGAARPRVRSVVRRVWR
ncbi:MAG: thymidine phosphorylase [Elusimicrobia bacterium CG1_02_63_36]|nr:MAG: thymidine phosphorylase [Elusimicrobia bacterium CG1_02_63_36]